MKAFRYLTALGLGAAVSLSEAAAPVSAQTQTMNPAEVTALVTANLVPELPRPESSGGPERSPVSKSPVSEANTPAASQTQVAQSVTGLVVAQVPVAQAPAVPVEAAADPIETEFLKEPAATSAQAPAPKVPEPKPSVPQVAPANEVSAPKDDKPKQVDEPKKDTSRARSRRRQPTEPKPPVIPTVDSAPKGTSLIDTQPNLFRPSNANDVVVDKAETISLEQAIEIARQNTPRIRVLQLQVEQADAAIREAKAALSPQVSTSTSLTQNGSASRTEQIYNEANDDPQGTADTTTKTNTTGLDANARIQYNIFQPGRSAAIRASEKRKEQAQLALSQDLS